MKELKDTPEKPIIQTHYPLLWRSQFQKPWIVAQSRKNFQGQMATNRSTEDAYMRIVQAAKQYLKSGDRYFERDYRRDKTENCCAMHSFMMPSFYIYLECNVDYNYRVEYAFLNCPFEVEIRAMLQPFPLDRQASEVSLKPDFESFYHGVLSIQKAMFIFTLVG